MLRTVRLSHNASIPTRATAGSAGLDLYSAYDYEIPAAAATLCSTDIQLDIPDGCYGRIAPRSGLAYNHSLQIGAGVIDSDYRGNIKILIFNHGLEKFIVSKGDKIAQLILETILIPEVIECSSLKDTPRGNKGFGSSGLQ